MAHQSTVPSSKVFDAVAVSATTVYYSGAASPKAGGNNIGTDVPYAHEVSFVVDFTSTPNGTLAVEVSNSDDVDCQKGTDRWTTYTPLTGGGFTAGVATITNGAIVGGATPGGIQLRARFRRVRLKYTNGSSSGTITAIVTVKA
jgi:hypothetical protein